MLTHLIALALTAQTPSQTAALVGLPYYQLLKEARKAEAGSDYQSAAEKFERLAVADPRRGEVWMELGNCYYQLKQPAKAIEPYTRALQLGEGALENDAYNIGCCCALAGQKEQAIQWIQKALAMRLEDRSMIQTDPDLASLHGDPRFKELAGLPPKDHATREERWRCDIDFLVGEMKRMHYRWSVEGLPKPIVEGAKSLKAKVGRLSDDQILVGMQRLMVGLEDGHSHIRFINPITPTKRLTVRFYRFDEGLYIIEAAAGQADLKGARVLSIGGKPVDELWAGLPKLVSRDNDEGVEWIGPMYLGYVPILKELGATTEGDSVTLKVVKASGEQADVRVDAAPFESLSDDKLAPLDPEKAPPYLKRVDDPYWFEPLPDAKAVYFQYNQVANKKEEPVADFALRLRKYLAENAVENLIVDVRHNGGGNSYLNRELVRTLVAFEAAKSGRIFLITGRNTFSAAQNFTNDVCRMTNAVVVGEPSSSSPFFIGEGAPFVLPYSKLHGTISTRMHTVDARDRRVWIAPEIPVPVTAADYLANRDAALDTILQLIKAG